MRPRPECSVGDEAMESCGFMNFTDEEMKATFLETLQKMRKYRLFCDVVLNVENADIHAHKNVLACASPFLMELFTAEQESNKTSHCEEIPSFRLNGGMSKAALEILVDYAYTAKLDVPDTLVKDVYLAAWKLRIDNVVKECARHLISELSPDSCIEIRSLPGIDKNKSFVQQVDDFIDKSINDVCLTSDFLQLPCVQIDVLYQTKEAMSLVTHGPLGRLVLDWIKRQLTDESLSPIQLLERTHLLYLALDNSLQDCSDLPPGHESDSELVQDYKRLVLKCPTNNKQRRKCLAVPGRPRVLLYSRDIGEREDENAHEPDWNFISSTKCDEDTFLAVATINGVLMRISVKLRLNNISKIEMPPAAVQEPKVQSSEINTEPKAELDLFCEVATMSGPKCGLGVADFNGKLLVCGGYDRGECLRKVESYCPETNMWTHESNMNEARGRVQIAVLGGTVYAVGGSNGTTELDTVECLRPDSKKWQKCCRLPLARSNAGVCSLNNKIYCIGGWNGQSGIKQCDIYSPEENKWTSISPLNTGRYQAGVCAYNGRLWAVGGSDAWTCLGSVENYDLEQDQWTYGPPLLTPRRGCGVAVFQDKLYAVGGSDGTQSLCSTEIFDEETKTWVLGPTLITPRSNVSVVVVQNKMYAIGGFSRKTFLNTMEYLDSTTNEWTTFVPHQQDAEKIAKVLLAENNTVNGINGIDYPTKSDSNTSDDKIVNKTNNEIFSNGNDLNGKNGHHHDKSYISTNGDRSSTEKDDLDSVFGGDERKQQSPLKQQQQQQQYQNNKGAVKKNKNKIPNGGINNHEKHSRTSIVNGGSKMDIIDVSTSDNNHHQKQNGIASDDS